ncbi:fused methyl-galactoside transporter subunits of ABC superfamily: ATP-binding components [uncultured Pleomorphomonas sp.]|uniref:Fused methyl-galactoside transporter subunits of ABC superfamily: ATP-binding components n=1 Tax=uncultured Pleomorphomonas sp. TaxID=442121 RepID=A0A212LH17_9HYPH|nr:sugar ABC transporter ATP-binding protein [uncultured Pleomorphomonas sp.]SCM76861.1 fused methyl-galactoside transporter subunits of ABC superfamily: ATP-binding components [uncultured Pleomorphomonas sp.]
MASLPLLEMRGIRKSFNRNPILNSVDLSVGRGEVHALMGENGAGKSTLMRILMGMIPPDGGDILLDGKPVAPRSPREAMDLGLAMIHQELNPVLDMEVAENVFLGRELRRFGGGPLGIVNHGAMRRACKDLFDRFSIPIGPTVRMRDLSVAQMQLVEIVKAISLSSKIVIMDEPTSAITDREVDILFRQIDTLRSHGVSIIYISHKMDEIFRIADRISVMRDGTMVASDAASAFDRDGVIRHMVGREVTNYVPKETVPIGETVLEVRNLSLDKRVDGVSFSVRAGEILGIAGLVGAGRSETVETLFGIRRASSGEILVRGQPQRIRSPGDAIGHRLALVTEDRKMTGLNLLGTVEENISLAAIDRISPFGMIDKRREHVWADDNIARLRIKTLSRDTLVSSLSGGNQQKVVLAKWLVTAPDVIILDEPTRGIDVGAKRDIYLVIGELARQGKAVIVISSELIEIMGLADRILVMAEGRITGELTRNAFSQEKIMELATPYSEIRHV